MVRRRGPAPLWWWSVGVLAAVVGANLALPVVTAFVVKGSLQTLLGARQVDVTLEAWPPPALLSGSVARLTVLAYDAQVGDLRLQRLSATFRELRIDPQALYGRGTLVIRSVGSGAGEGTMSQEALAQALSRQTGVHVDALVLQAGQVRIRGTVRVLGTDLPVEGGGRLVLNGSDAVDLILDRATVLGAVAATGVSGQLAIRVSSVLRIPPLPFGLRPTGVRVGDGRLLIDAATGPS